MNISVFFFVGGGGEGGCKHKSQPFICKIRHIGQRITVLIGR